jgi:hypothetical protein
MPRFRNERSNGGEKSSRGGGGGVYVMELRGDLECAILHLELCSLGFGDLCLGGGLGRFKKRHLFGSPHFDAAP